MTSSETARAIVFVSLVVLGCLIRTYIRTANGEKEDEAHFWSSRFSQQQEHTLSSEKAPVSAQHASIHTLHHLGADAHRPRSTNTSSGEVSQAVSVLHEQPPRFAPFLAETVPDEQHSDFLPAVTASTSLHPGSIHTCDGSEVDEAYEDWAAMHHARGAVSEDAETSIDNLLQRRQLHKAMGMQSLGDFDALDASGAETPTIWTAQFPAAQLRPY
ncbi:Ubiquitin carboxyl-terminal hydrolase [Pseudozyma hubeiensis]|nr:Ubiquitin carboxyl-terminal hydrolase [Pseudozyma hubeiensis]